MDLKRYIPLSILISSIAMFQIIVTAIDSEYYLTQFTMSAYYVLVILGLTLLMGYAGQISIGHASFFAIGGYTAAALSTLNLNQYSSYDIVQILTSSGLLVSDATALGETILHVSPWIALAASIAITILIALIVGVPLLSLKGHYLAMATLGFGVIIYQFLLGTPFFGEADGISAVPPFRLFGGISVSGDPGSRVSNYYIAWTIIIIAVILLINLINSRIGRALRSIHGSEDAAAAMGINTAKYKLIIFIISAVFACVGGFFMTHFNGGIGPCEASVMKSVRYVSIVAIGGMANIWGSMFMGILLNYLSLRGYFGSLDDVVYGAILILMMMFFPDGILRKENLNNLQGICLIKRLKFLKIK